MGNLKESYWKDAVSEYGKRLKRYCDFSIVEVKESREPDNASPADWTKMKETEGMGILKNIKKEELVIALAIDGVKLDSERLADKIRNFGVTGKSNLTFLIGGSFGLSQEVLDSASLKFSFSDLTFPHQLMRVMLTEQIYRSFKIIHNETYHK